MAAGVLVNVVLLVIEGSEGGRGCVGWWQRVCC